MDWLIGNTTESTDETPQENSAQPASGYSIWGQLKKMSTNVIEMYKEDLNEFATTVVHDTKEFTHHIKTENEEEPSQEKGESHLGLSYLASKVVKSVDNLTAKIDSLGETVMQTLSTAVIVPDQPTQHQSANGFDRLSSRIMAAQNDPNTFLEPPSDQKAFTEFITVFDVNQHDHDIVSVMRSNQNMSQLYDRIVPSAVSRETFWSRYFFTIHHIYRDEERRAALVQQADAVEELEVGWGDDDDDTTSAFVDEPAAVLETQVPNSNSIPASVDQDGQNVSQSIEQGISELEITDPPRFESLVGSQISQSEEPISKKSLPTPSESSLSFIEAPSAPSSISSLPDESINGGDVTPEKAIEDMIDEAFPIALDEERKPETDIPSDDEAKEKAGDDEAWAWE